MRNTTKYPQKPYIKPSTDTPKNEPPQPRNSHQHQQPQRRRSCRTHQSSGDTIPAPAIQRTEAEPQKQHVLCLFIRTLKKIIQQMKSVLLKSALAVFSLFKKNLIPNTTETPSPLNGTTYRTFLKPPKTAKRRAIAKLQRKSRDINFKIQKHPK